MSHDVYVSARYLLDSACCVSKQQLIIVDNFCIALFSGVHKFTALYNILIV